MMNGGAGNRRSLGQRISGQYTLYLVRTMAVMLAVITFASYKLSMPVFIVLVGILSAVGFASAAIMFCKWLQKPSEREEDDLDIIHFKATPRYGEESDKGYEMTYEQIKQEVEGDL